MSAYAYPPANHGQNSEAYRASPTGSNVSLPSLNLPPIRTMDGRPQSQQGQQAPQHQSQQQVGQPQMGAPLPPPMGSYYPAMPGQSLPPPQHMSVTSDPNQPMRYPLPPPDGRMMSGGRHKKEIKRRTKTGCLTCRKRRIKCDEVHPACRNCQKSKRECLGYDPIFKPQPGPAAIQPAPSAAPSMQPTPASAPPYPPPPQGYVAASSQSYTPPNLLTNTGSPNTASEQQFDYSAAIDPTLASSLQSKGLAEMYNGTDVKRLSATGSPYPPAAISTHHSAEHPRLNELIAIDGVPPAPLAVTQPLPPNVYEDIKLCYEKVYGPSIDKFLETQWFTNRAMNYVLEDAQLCEQIASLIVRFSINPQTPAFQQQLAATRSLETRIIWSIMSIARRVANGPDPSNGHIAAEEVSAGVQNAAKRVEIVQNLLLGQYLDNESTLTEDTRNGTAFEVQLNQRERDFWRLIHKYLTVHDDEASASHELDETVNAARELLDSRENRDVIYSMAIVRLHVGRENLANLSQQNNGGGNSQDKGFNVAKGFLRDQAGGKGTNQVVQRLCGMAMNAWALPR
ncbi:MAG: hypothetical protein Q9179_000250 [Wetmoreana sp. 5 TL-2023]